jgi:hypothetical protein
MGPHIPLIKIITFSIVFTASAGIIYPTNFISPLFRFEVCDLAGEIALDALAIRIVLPFLIGSFVVQEVLALVGESENS